ncbi:SDR family oxidoreductase [Blastomonas sp. AAP53]|uniref:SDR family NAD(P)-dependent oxidoreductase n=1 Tax=Blastomonas sp. AAP53 TaxID=1248760 RepID=UPI00030648F7|nr:SDR family oxidoreductase [Blastomonas sp. AAP53]
MTQIKAAEAGTDRAIYPSLANKRVLITGGASGIGAALVEQFAQQGAAIAFLDVDDAAGEALALTIAGAHYHHCDLRDLDALNACMTTVIGQLGGIDVLVNNAANDDRHDVMDVTAAYWDERMATNLRHLFFTAQAVVPAMRAAGGGAIINFGSISWHLGLPDLVLYQTAKAAIEGMTRGLARDLGRDNIRVTTIVPGNVQTPRQERWYTPEGEAEIVAAQCLSERIQPADVAAMALFLASDDSRMCTGHEYFVDAGWR